MGKINRSEIFKEISREQDIPIDEVTKIVHSFYQGAAKIIAGNEPTIIEIKHLGKFSPNKNVWKNE